MEMIVCVKQVLDPEAPPASFRIDPAGKGMVLPAGIPPVISTFDEHALEAALRIKDSVGGRITALSLGAHLLRDVVKKPLAMGADRLVLLEDPAFEGGDSWSAAYALAKAIETIGVYDLIFCGRQSADWDGGQVGLGIAELLNIPCITLAKKVDIIGGNVQAEQVTAEGHEIVEASPPAVITVSSELGQPRFTTIQGIFSAKNKEILVWRPADIGVEPSQVGASGRRMKLLKLFQPHRESACEIIQGDTPADAGARLALRLRESKML